MSTNSPTRQNKPVFKLNVPDDQFKFQPLPKPSTNLPYHLDLGSVLSENIDRKLVFHMVGDTGSAKQPEFQRLVAAEMITQYNQSPTPADRPLFLYHLGDVVYHFGEAEEYYRQFFEPYKNYPGPIFAIAGNHDSDVNLSAKKPYRSLDPFVHVFCNTGRKHTSLAEGTGRTTMNQPNIYWTLDTPLATIIGLYSNVPKFGTVTTEQKKWFINELKAAKELKKVKALIVCIHHAPYSADTNHGSSKPMIEFLEEAYEQAGVRPHIVFSGHVHNYQRFSKRYADGSVVPYIVAGAGGYATLFPIAGVNDMGFTTDSPLLQNVQLDHFCDDQHGFLKITVDRTTGQLTLTGEYYTIPHTLNTDTKVLVQLYDRFTVDLNA